MKRISIAIILVFMFGLAFTCFGVDYKYVIHSFKGDVTIDGKTPPKSTYTLTGTEVIEVQKGGEVIIMARDHTIAKVVGPKKIMVMELFRIEPKPTLFSKLVSIRDKILKKQGEDNSGPTAVAGVRGADVYKQNQLALKKELYWEE